jgi:hypothetical protein
MTCPECAKRPYLCFEHNEEAREDEEALAIFVRLCDERRIREQVFAEKLARDAFFFGRKVAKGELLLTRAQEILKAKADVLDETMPIYAYVLTWEARESIVAKGFAAGLASVRRAHG